MATIRKRKNGSYEIRVSCGYGVVYAVAPEPPARTPRATLPHFESHFHRVENHNKKEPA